MTDRPILVPYDPEWARRFESERALLEAVLSPWLEGGIEHVGSTAVPGLAAKPIIDMVARVRGLEEARGAFEPLCDHSCHHAPHRPDGHWFCKPSLRLSERTHNLHLTQPGSDLWLERLAFRDALRNDAAVAAEYERLKLQLARDCDDLEPYTAGKREFVARVLAGAGIQLRPWR